MALFAVTFRVNYDDGYDARYEGVVSFLKLAASDSGRYWDETTSFFLLDYDGRSSQLAEFVCNGSDFDERQDLLVVINLARKGYAVRGAYADRDLDTLMQGR